MRVQIFHAVPEAAIIQRKCAVITSYNPQAADITLEDTGAASETDKQFISTPVPGATEGCRSQARHDEDRGFIEEQAKALFVKGWSI